MTSGVYSGNPGGLNIQKPVNIIHINNKIEKPYKHLSWQENASDKIQHLSMIQKNFLKLSRN